MELWEIVGKRPVGRPRAFNNPEEIWHQACQYFQWASTNSLIEEKAFCYEGSITKAKINKCRAFTINGLCLFMGVDVETWNNYRNKPEFFGVIKACEEIIREQKFSAAAAGLLHPVIIARDLGLREITDHVSSDGTMTPKAPAPAFDASKLSDEVLAALMAARHPSP